MNKFAITSGGVGDALSRSASAMRAANNTLDETIALITAANTVVQNPDVVGTTMKTVSMYLRAAKTEAEEAGISTDGMADSVSKLREELLALTGNRVDLMLDEDTFKSTYQILKELSEVWDDLTDVSQANILAKIAGKRNANAVAAVLGNFDVAERALQVSQNADGSALKENEKVLDSVQGKLNQLAAAWQTLSTSVLQATWLKWVIDLLKILLETLNKLNEKTGGASSALLGFIIVVTTVRSVIGAFQKNIGGLGTVIEVLSAATKGTFSPLAKLSSLLGGVSAQATAGTLATQGLSMATFGYMGIALAAAWGLMRFYDEYRKAHPSLEQLREDFDGLTSDISSLNAELDENRSRIEELQELADAGTISVVEQDELDRLKAENDLLEAQLLYKEKLADMKRREIQSKQLGAYENFTAEPIEYYEHGVTVYQGGSEKSQYQRLQDAILEQKDLNAELQGLYAERSALLEAGVSPNDKSVTDLNKREGQITKRLTELSSFIPEQMDAFESIIKEFEYTSGDNLTPEQEAMNAAIDQFYKLVDAISLCGDEAAALGKVFDRYWNDETRHPGLQSLREELTQAASAQAQYNEELKKYGSNIDLTNRKVLQYEDVAGNDIFSNAAPGDYLTLNAKTFSAADFGGNGTEAIVVTPILPDGTVFDSQKAFEEYVASLLKSDGSGFDVGKDTKGITIGVFDAGDTEGSIAKAKQMAAAAQNVNQSWATAFQSDGMQDFLAHLEDIGVEVEDLSQSELAAMFEEVKAAAQDASVEISGLSEQIASLSAGYDLIQETKDELAQFGNISISTLQKLEKQFPNAADSINLFAAGIITSKELIESLSGAYETDVDNYEKSLREKLALSPSFYNTLTANQKQLIDELAGSYKDDLANFKSIEAKKLEFQALMIQQLATNYSRYANASLDGLKAEADNMLISGGYDPVERERLDATINAIDKFNMAMKEIMDGTALITEWDPKRFGKPSSSSADKWKEEAEAKIALLKHQLEMEEITSAQYYDGLEAIENAYYKNSAANQKKYAAEIRSIDEELFTGRRELFDDWMNDQEHHIDMLADARNIAAQERAYQELLVSIEKKISQAKDYGLDENSDYIQTLRDSARQYQEDWLNLVKDTYDEYIDYMDDFDLWNRTGESRVATLEKMLADIDAQYERGALSWTAYVEAHNEAAKRLYDSQKDALEEIIDRTMEMIKQESQDQIDAIDDQIDAFDDLINKKKELLRETREEADYEDEVAEKVKEISKLQSQINQLSLDDSRDATAQRIALEEQLAEKQRELEKFQRDHALDATEDALDKEAEAYKDAKEDEKKLLEKSIDSWVKLYEKAMDRINNDWDSLYDDLMDYEMEHRDSIDGPDSLVTAWDAASKAVEKYGSFIAALDQNGENLGIDPNANFGQAADILREMEKNSKLAKEAGTSQIGDVNLHDRNKELAAQYQRLTGEALDYDKNRGWYFVSTGKLAYGTEPSKPSASSPNQSASGDGKAYQATVNEYGTPPSGTVKKGSTNTKAVKWIQGYLQKLGIFKYTVDGTFYDRTEDAVKEFQRRYMSPADVDGMVGPKTLAKMKKYHTGGVVDGTGAINSKEVLAILQKGELVLTAKQKDNLRAILGNIKAGLGGMLSANLTARMDSMRQAVPAGSVSPAFSPTINVVINHSGKMTDADADKYGRKIANTALDTLYNTMRTRGIK